jgi:hypothetical protein
LINYFRGTTSMHGISGSKFQVVEL